MPCCEVGIKSMLINFPQLRNFIQLHFQFNIRDQSTICRRMGQLVDDPVLAVNDGFEYHCFGR